MRKYLMALAATTLLASQAGAATIEGPTTVTAGEVNTYTYVPDLPVELVEGYTFYTMFLEINDGWENAPTGASLNFFGFEFPEDGAFSFDWVFTESGPFVMSISSVLVSYVNPTLIEDEDGNLSVDETNKPLFSIFNTGRGARLEEGGFDDRVSLQISVVPIGSTLPLLLSALGALGWVARRRSKAAALPA